MPRNDYNYTFPHGHTDTHIEIAELNNTTRERIDAHMLAAPPLIKYDIYGYIASFKNLRINPRSLPDLIRNRTRKSFKWEPSPVIKTTWTEKIWTAIEKSKKYELHLTSDNKIQLYIVTKKKIKLTNLTLCLACGKLTKNHKFNICFDCQPYINICKKCGNSMFKSYIIESKVDGQNYCAKCWRLKYFRCSVCGREILNTEKQVEIEENELCYKCFVRNASICYRCKGITLRRDTHIYKNHSYCFECYNNMKVIKEYNYIPTFKYTKRNWDNNLYLGVEIEIEPENQYLKSQMYETTEDEEISKEIYEKWAYKTINFLKKNKLNQYFYIKHDGTIRGFELVSHPSTLGFIHDNLQFYKILEWFKKNKFTSFKSGRCGLHIHLNRLFFSDLELEKIRVFFTTNKQMLNIFSKRKGINSRYFRYEKYEIKSVLHEKPRQDGKYWALRVNPNGKSTIEMRIFRGTLFYPRFIATLQFADALAHFVKETSILNSSRKNSWLDFVEWCKKTCNYGHFLNYIKNDKTLFKIEEVSKCV